MALPPTIPTSFVPYSASAATREYRSNYSGAFKFFIFGVLGITMALAVGVFVYERILTGMETSRVADLTNEENKVNASDIQDFLRLRNRLVQSKMLLDGHIAFSTFFNALGSILPATSRLSALHLTVGADGKVQLDAAGAAKNFNSLAVLSSQITNDGRIKDAIFSNIEIDQKNNSVSFSLAATLEPKIVEFAPETLTVKAGQNNNASSTTSMSTTTKP